MNKETHTRNQKRMYRIHKLEEKIHNQDLLIGTLQQKIDKALEDVDKLEKGIMNNTLIGFKQFIPEFELIKEDLKGDKNE